MMPPPTNSCIRRIVAVYCGMFGVTTSDDYKPVTWMGRFPVDVTTILVGLHVLMAIFTALLVASGAGAVLDYLHFDSARVLGTGQVWRLGTYAFVHSPSMLLWFATSGGRWKNSSGSGPTSCSIWYCCLPLPSC